MSDAEWASHRIPGGVCFPVFQGEVGEVGVEISTAGATVGCDCLLWQVALIQLLLLLLVKCPETSDLPLQHLLLDCRIRDRLKVQGLFRQGSSRTEQMGRETPRRLTVFYELLLRQAV